MRYYQIALFLVVVIATLACNNRQETTEPLDIAGFGKAILYDTLVDPSGCQLIIARDSATSTFYSFSVYSLRRKNGISIGVLDIGETFDFYEYEDESTFHGAYKSYHSGGTPNQFGQYEHGKKIGIWCEYVETGKLNQIFDYSNGREDTLLDNHLEIPIHQVQER